VRVRIGFALRLVKNGMIVCRNRRDDNAPSLHCGETVGVLSCDEAEVRIILILS